MVLHSVVCKFTHGDTPAPLQTRVGGHHSRSNKLTVCHGGVLITGCPRTPHEGPPMQRSSLVNSRGERPGERGATQRAMDAARREELVLGWPTTGTAGRDVTSRRSRSSRARLWQKKLRGTRTDTIKMVGRSALFFTLLFVLLDPGVALVFIRCSSGDHEHQGDDHEHRMTMKLCPSQWSAPEHPRAYLREPTTAWQARARKCTHPYPRRARTHWRSSGPRSLR